MCRFRLESAPDGTKGRNFTHSDNWFVFSCFAGNVMSCDPNSELGENQCQAHKLLSPCDSLNESA